jgi:multiple antibiotic resistance protein
VDETDLITFTTAMFTILNPIGNVAIFASMVADRSMVDRRSIAIKCAIAVAVILIATVWIGEVVLSFFGVEIPSLQVAGGLMIASIALSMLHSRQSAIHDTKKGEDSPAPKQDIAVVPLAMPMIAGPGTMVTVIVSTHQNSGLVANLEMSGVCAALAAAICVGFLAAGPITRVLGTKGMDIVTKLMGVVLLAIAIGMFATGAKGLLPGLAG